MPGVAAAQLLQVPAALDYGALSAAAAFMPATPLGAAGLRFLPASPSHSGNTGLAPSSLDSRSASETLTAGGFTPPPPGASNGLTTPTPGSHHAAAALAGSAMSNGSQHARHAGIAAQGLPASLSNAMAAVASSVGFGGLPGIGLSNSFSFDRRAPLALCPDLPDLFCIPCSENALPKLRSGLLASSSERGQLSKCPGNVSLAAMLRGGLQYSSLG